MTIDDEIPVRRPLSRHVVDPLPSAITPRRELVRGRFVSLEPLDPAAHAEELYAISHRDAATRTLWEFIPQGPWPDLAGFQGWLRDTASRLDRVAFAIRDAAGGNAGGMVQYHHIDAKVGVVEIGGIWFAPEFRRSRGATEVLYLVLAHAFDELGYRRVQWRCDAHNERSRAAVRRLGFGFEGIFYNETIIKGLNKDTAWYSLLDYEWPAVKDKMLSWLADDNFDGDGRALTSLSALTRRPPSE